jgi:RNA polymerase sigma factor (sigma-70 family)
MTEDAQPVLLDFLTKRYADLKRRLTRILRNSELADDAMQDTWLRLKNDGENNADIKSPQAYLLRMAANAAMDIRRRHGQSLPHEDIAELMEIADAAPGPEQVAGARVELDLMVELLNRLPARQREVMVLVRLEELPQKEVAKRLGVSLRTVELDLKRAHEYLEARMSRAKK